jgi:chromate transport protein ChrA
MPNDVSGSPRGANRPVDPFTKALSPGEAVPVEARPATSARGSPREGFLAFLKLGLTAFGGPIAHLGYFQRELIERRKWITQSAYGDLVALCHFLPGPASSQVAFSLGYLRAGLGGAFAATAGFTSPSAILMIAIGYSFQAVDAQAGLLQGLKLAAVALVAQAVGAMAAKFCPDRERLALALVAACVTLVSSLGWVQVVVIAAGAALGGIFFREKAQPEERASVERGLRGGGFAGSCLALFFVLLAGLPCSRRLFRTAGSSGQMPFTARERSSLAAVTWSCRCCSRKPSLAAGLTRTRSWPATGRRKPGRDRSSPLPRTWAPSWGTPGLPVCGA